MKSPVEQFTGRAEAYAQFRQRYPAEAIRSRLATWCGLDRSWHVTDVGAGTGMLSEVFLQAGNAVTAVEPNPEMRAVCDRLRASWPALTVLEGSAESTGLAESSTDVVIAGRAFHWFAIDTALQEFRRILRPSGWVVVVHTTRAEDSSPQAREFRAVLDRFRAETSDSRARHDIYARLPQLFTNFHQEAIAGETALRFRELVGFAHSTSGVPLGLVPEAARFEEELQQFFDRWARDGVLQVSTDVTLSAGRLPSV